MEIKFWIPILVAVIIILSGFIIATIIHKNSSINTKEQLKQETKIIDDRQKKNNLFFLKESTNNLFEKYLTDYENINIDSSVSKMNNQYKETLKQIINSPQYKSLTSDEKNDFYKESIFLKDIYIESPFTWTKKFGKEIKEYYVK